VGLTIYMYVCSKCGRPHSAEEFSQSRFCRNCGKFLSFEDKQALNEVSRKNKAASRINGNEDTIERTYRLIQQNLSSDTLIDSSKAVKQVEEYRQFWKPEKTDVILLAESHVYTDEKDYAIKMNRSILHRIVPNYPLHFVRFVYCLGYGENELLNRVRTDRRNVGTPQYWKIFSSCVAENENNLGFRNILKTTTQSFSRRIRNKVHVLKKMKTAGIWLLDASIVGLYGSGTKDPDTMETIIELCWRNSIADMISEANPKHVIVIGKGVGNILNSRIRRLGFPQTVISQPQARGSSEWQLENYKKYQRICARYS